MMSKPASTKDTEMIRRATEPMESISSEALKNISSCWGKSWKIRHPTAMMAMAVQMVSLMVRFTRGRLAAP